jgi:Trehalose utilisation
MKSTLLPALLLSLTFIAFAPVRGADFVVYEGKSGPGHGKHVVFLTGDEEYRSEEGLPQLARILADRHGFKCTVCFSIDKNGDIDPNTTNNESGLEALDSADACVILTRFRVWPDDQMKHFADYYLAGKPFVGLRTATHAFAFPPQSTYGKFGWNNKTWPGGFGRQVLGETWINHWGGHKHQATRGVIEPSAKDDPILRGVTDVFGTTDVYEAEPQADAKILLRGQVLTGMNPTDGPASGPKKRKDGQTQDLNDPMMPIAWTREPQNEAGKTNKVLCTTMGAATDLTNEGLRRLIVNGVYWGCGLEIPASADVALVGDFKPTFYGPNEGKKGVKPESLAAPATP